MQADSLCIAFGARVRELRKKVGFSQEELGDRASLHRTYISGIERGERNISLLNLVKVARALEILPSQLLEGIE